MVEAGIIRVSSFLSSGNAKFYVYGEALNELDSVYTNKDVELFPGTYTVSLNEARTAATVQAGERSVLPSGVLTVSGTENRYSDIYDAEGNPLKQIRGDKAIELFPGNYSVILGDTKLTATVVDGQNVSLDF